MINMFISIILDGYNTSRLEEIMRIHERTIEIFKEKWVKYDEDGTSLIKREDFRCLIIDLVLEELRMLDKLQVGENEDEDDLNVLFNLRLNKSLVAFAKHERKLEGDTPILSAIAKSYRL